MDGATFARYPPARKPKEAVPMPPIRLTDDELTAVFDAAAPLDVAMRDQFLQQVATSLGGYREIGPGLIHRICAEAQRHFFDPPDLTKTKDVSKYRR
jgi:hypothetical protein